MKDPHDKDFLEQASQAEKGLLGDMVDLLKHNKKWWLAPLLIVLLALGGLVLLGGTAAAPFIYTLF